MLTIRAVAAMKPGTVLWDDKLPGFGARRQAHAISYILKFRVHGVQRLVTLGRHGVLTPDQARRKARAMLGTVASGNDPVPRSDAFSIVAETYLSRARDRQRPSTFAHTQLYLQRYWRPLHRLPIAGVKRRDVALALAEIEADHGPAVADRARAALSGMFSWCIREGHDLPANPVIGTNRPARASRDRVLSETELAAIWRACNGSDFGRIVRLLILTGQRRDEIGMLRWSEIDTEAAIIRLPGSRTKNHREHLVPLSPLALNMLPPSLLGKDHVFGNGRGFTGYSHAKAALDAACGVSGWRLHDIRRSCATIMADRLGVLPHIIEAVLNHVSGHRAGVAGVYNRARYQDDCRAALCAWADYIEGLVR